MILSLQNKLIKKIASLKQKKYRDEFGQFCVEGIRQAEDALASGWPVKMCFYTKPALDKGRVSEFLAKLSGGSSTINKITSVEVSQDVYAKITDTKEPQGIMLVLEKRTHSLNELFKSLINLREKMPLIAVLDAVSDPGNAGAIIRTANAAGCAGVILLKGSADLFNGKTLRSAMGSVFHIPVIEDVEHGQMAALLKRYGIGLLVSALDSEARVYHQHDLQKPLAVVFGNEGGGISQEMLSLADGKIYIPLSKQAESLNVSVAAGIILYEAARQHSSLRRV